jgi:hypothetical protein
MSYRSTPRLVSEHGRVDEQCLRCNNCGDTEPPMSRQPGVPPRPNSLGGWSDWKSLWRTPSLQSVLFDRGNLQMLRRTRGIREHPLGNVREIARREVRYDQPYDLHSRWSAVQMNSDPQPLVVRCIALVWMSRFHFSNHSIFHVSNCFTL